MDGVTDAKGLLCKSVRQDAGNVPERLGNIKRFNYPISFCQAGQIQFSVFSFLLVKGEVVLAGRE